MKFSKQSQAQLSTCCKELQEIFSEVVEICDCTIVEGYRDQERQNKLFASGLSKVEYPNGKHNKNPSDAVDVYPYIKMSGISYKNDECCFLAGVVLAVAAKKGYSIRWGGRWDSDSISTNKFKDLGHYEIIRK